MATIYTDTATGQNANLAGSLVDGNKVTGRIAFARGTYTTDGNTAATDILRIVKLPKGAIVVPGASFVDTEDCGTDITLTVGDEITPDVDKYSTALSLATAGRIAFVSGVAGPNPAPLTAETWITATVGDAGSISVTSGKDFTVWIGYILP
jgi:hypothetical protein